MIGRGTDKHEFECVHEGSWYRLASLSAHLKRGVTAGQYLLFDATLREKIVPASEVAIPNNPIHWARRKVG